MVCALNRQEGGVDESVLPMQAANSGGVAVAVVSVSVVDDV